MSPKCYICEHEAGFHYQALEVLTFHIRDLSGHRRIQGIGEYVTGDVCRECAEKRLDDILHPFRKPTVIQIVMALVTALGIGLIASMHRYGMFYISTGVFFVVGGILYLVGTYRSASKKMAEFASYKQEEALDRAAWDLLEEKLPKKAGENNITYIPINPQTMKRKNGDLMVLYNLLPENAVEIHKQLHRDFTGQAVRKQKEEEHGGI